MLKWCYFSVIMLLEERGRGLDMRYAVMQIKNCEFIGIYEYFDTLEDAIECMNKLNRRHMDIENGCFYSIVDLNKGVK